MRPLIRTLCVSLLIAPFVVAESPDFSKDIAPILNTYCVGCHGADDPDAQLRLDSFDALVKGGENGTTINAKKLETSLLLKRILDTDEPMPPEGEPRPEKAELELLLRWIKAGAPASETVADPTVVDFDSVEPSEAPRPITAIAFGRGGGSKDGRELVLTGNGAMSAIDIKSKGGFLRPIDPQPPVPAPFTFFLSNTRNNIAVGAALGTTAKVEGELRLGIFYTGDDPMSDLKVEYGDDQFNTIKLPYRLEGNSRAAVASFGQVLCFDEMKADKPKYTLSTAGKVHDVRFGKNGTRLLAASGIAGLRGEAILWDMQNGEQLQTFNGHTDAIYAAAISNDGKLVATGSYDRKIIIWDAASGEEIRTLSGHNGAIYDVDFSPDAKVLVSASADTTVKVWNVATGERLDTLGQPLKEQYSVDISPDGKRIVAGGEDNRIRVWQLVSIDKPQINPLVFARFAHEGPVEQVRFSNDGSHVVSSSSDATVKIWSAEMELLNAYDIPETTTEALAITPDGRQIGVGTVSGKVKTMQLVAAKTSASTTGALARATSRSQKEVADVSELEPNDRTLIAQSVSIPARIKGVVHSVTSPRESTDEDVFQFAAKAGEEWIFEVKAARDKSPLDSHIAILAEDGSAVPRVQLQAVRDTYFTFRGKDSNGTGDFRLHNWEEMKLNQLLYANGEVVKLFHYPRGPDSGFNVYPNFGNRRGFFDTTPLAHALHEPAYIVEPHPPGVELPPNGLPTFTLNYENDDDSQRRLGKDSRLTFVAPRDGDYFVRLRDIRGGQGADFKYELKIRAPEPGFKCKVLNSNPKVVAGTGKKFGVEVERIDGFSGPIDIEITGLPDGFSVPGPLQIEAEHDRVWATLIADEGTQTPEQEAIDAVKIVATARIGTRNVEQMVGSLGKIEVEEAAKLLVDLIPDHAPTMGESAFPVVELKAGGTTTATIRITRNDHDGRVGFGNESGAINAPHGVYVDNIGLNGVLIVEGQSERQFFVTAEPWVEPMERVIFVEAGAAGNPTSNPVMLRILPADR